MKDSATVSERPADHVLATVQRLVGLATRGLVPMYAPNRRLFCYTLKKTEQGMAREGISQRYSMMTLMGLHRLEIAGGKSPIEIGPVLDGLLSKLDWIEDIGDLGVLLWTCAQLAPERLHEVERRVDLKNALVRYRGAKQGVTMELAWFLTGLAYWGLADASKLSELRGLSFETYAMLQKNRGAQGFFGHLSTDGSLSGRLRGRIGSFADQVYPMYAMTQFSKAYQHEEAAERALTVGQGLCEAQGELGQWWWHYDSKTGRVVDGYPVFSVHQHAMAPMTLFALGEAFGRDFSPWIYKGLEWINSQNELNFDMEDASAGVVWRCIERSRRSLGRYLKLGCHSRPIQESRAEQLAVFYECRPYELGWLLYAFAPKMGKPNSQVLRGSVNIDGVAAGGRGNHVGV
jgi:hypothetical protein